MDSYAGSVAQNSLQFEFSAKSLSTPPQEGEAAPFEEFDLTFSIKDRATQQPLYGKRPGAWIDSRSSALRTPTDGCRQKIEGYLKSSTGARPIVDLTSYYILAFNHDASISVIDPLVGISGRSNLLASIALSGSPADWTKSPDERRIYVSMPSSGKIAIIDAESFRLLEEIKAGDRPTRIALSADGRYVFVANDAEADEAGGLTIIEAQSGEMLKHIPTGRGHHEIARSQSGEFLFVSNRENGDVSVIDVASLKPVMRIPIGKTPIALAYSKLAQALYVADGTDGTVTVIDGRAPHITSRITARPGLGPIAITPDERWALVINARENLVHVIEIATNRIVQNIAVGVRPYQILLSDSFAYVVSLDSERVGMISLRELGKSTAEQTSSFAAGASPPVDARGLGVGSLITRAVGDAAVIVANPADKTIYYYMEGMLAPSGSFLNPGREVRSIGVIDHGLKERSPGEYSARARLPSGANYDVAILLGSAYGCFPLTTSTKFTPPQTLPKIEYLDAPAISRPNETFVMRFRLTGGKKPDVTSKVSVRCYSYAGGKALLAIDAQEVEEGVFEARLNRMAPGAYYIYIIAPAWGLNDESSPSRNFLVRSSE